MRTISIPLISPLKFIRLYLEFLKPVTSLRSRENQVLSVLLFKRYLYITEEGMKDGSTLYKLLFSTTVRTEIREQLRMSYASFGNAIALMKSKGILQKEPYGLSISPKMRITPDKQTTLKITFKGIYTDETKTY